MVILAWAAPAVAGEVWTWSEGPRAFVQLSDREEPVTLTGWAGQPLAVAVVVDLSGSVLGRREAVEAQSDALLAAVDHLAERGVAGDRVGLTVFAGRARVWEELQAPSEDLAVRMAELRAPDGVAADEAERPRDLGLGDRTDAQKGVRAAVSGLLATGDATQKALVLVWDGGQNGRGDLRRALDRAERHGIHVWSVGVGQARPLDLEPHVRGAGAAYVAGSHAADAIDEILTELDLVGR